MKHEITVNFATLFNIFCAAETYYNELKRKAPNNFNKEDENEMGWAHRLAKFTIETEATTYKIEDK